MKNSLAAALLSVLTIIGCAADGADLYEDEQTADDSDEIGGLQQALTNKAWTYTSAHPTIYNAGDWATLNFAPQDGRDPVTGLPAPPPTTGTVSTTTVLWSWSSYNNGASSEVVQLCWLRRYGQRSEIPDNCIDVSTVRSGSTTAFAGKDARGSFHIRHQLFGGSFPAIGRSTEKDTVTVNYTY